MRDDLTLADLLAVLVGASRAVQHSAALEGSRTRVLDIVLDAFDRIESHRCNSPQQPVQAARRDYGAVMLNLERLRALQAVARHGSVVAAAGELHVTPSAISQQLTKLERELGQSLIERHGRGVRLTPAADLLVIRTGEILSLVAKAQAELEDRSCLVSGRLVLGAFATAARDLTTQAVRMLREQHAGLEFAVHELEPPQAIAGLLAGDLDLAVVQEWTNSRLPRPAGLALTPLLDDVVDLAVPVNSPLARVAEVELASLGTLDWIASPTGSLCHDWLRQTLRERGYEPRIVHTAAEVPNQVALVAAGLGLAVVPRLGRLAQPGVVFVPLRPALQREVLLAGRLDAARRPVIRAATAAFEAAARRVEARSVAGGTIDLRVDRRIDPDPVPRPR
ncbi:MAG TPA: LysR family transcriptional regulator [Kineosporiaceae bacterium]|nr:LysR family transcriptional regulator [Kineosporiaceae bacterium]